MQAAPSPRFIGRYALYDHIASGGMAAVHIGRLVGPVGFSRTVAIKQLHAQYAKDPAFVAMFIDEARLAARIQHQNVVSTLDVVTTDGELFVVMEFVRGESLLHLLRACREKGERVAPRVAAFLLSGTLMGLHAAHEARDERGAPLGIVHRDVSPHNILVGIDGTPRVLDFGVAKANEKVHTTRDGDLKGKLIYMPPEQLEGQQIDRRADIYAAGLVLFETLTGRRMFTSSADAAQVARMLRNEITLPSAISRDLVPFDIIVRKATARDPYARYGTARDMALDVERCMGVASPAEVAVWVERTAGPTIEKRIRRIAEIESMGQFERGAIRAELDTIGRIDTNPSGMTPVGPFGAGVSAPYSGQGSIPLPPDSQRLPPPSVPSSFTPAPHLFGVAPATRTPWLALGLGTALVTPLLVAAFFLGRSRGVAPVASAAASASLDAPSAQVVDLPDTSRTAIPAPPVTSKTPPASAATESASSSAALAPRASASGASRPSAKPAPRPAEANAGQPDCEQPYAVDGQGHLHFRKECL